MIEIIDAIGEPRFLMPLEFQQKKELAAALPVFGDAGSPPLIPRDQWKPTSLGTVTPAIKDQDGVGACNAFATVITVEIARAAAGLDYVELSPGYLYGSINGQRDQGSLLEDAIRWMTQHGTCTAATVPPIAWRRNQWPSAAATEAQHYRVLEWWWAPTTEHLVSGIMRGFAANIGVMWYGADNPNADGWLPDRPRGQAGGHAIARDEVVFDGSRWGVGGPNSWSPRWGKQGRMIFSEQRLKAEEGNFGWFLTRAVTFPSDGGLPTPV